MNCASNARSMLNTLKVMAVVITAHLTISRENPLVIFKSKEMIRALLCYISIFFTLCIEILCFII